MDHLNGTCGIIAREFAVLKILLLTEFLVGSVGKSPEGSGNECARKRQKTTSCQLPGWLVEIQSLLGWKNVFHTPIHKNEIVEKSNLVLWEDPVLLWRGGHVPLQTYSSYYTENH